MKKLVFDLEDFDWSCMSSAQACSKAAQAKFDEWYHENIESAPLVYGKKFKICATTNWCATQENEHHDVQARLVDIQEIKKECVKHEPVFIDQSYKLPDIVRCKHCHVELINEWKVKP